MRQLELGQVDNLINNHVLLRRHLPTEVRVQLTLPQRQINRRASVDIAGITVAVTVAPVASAAPVAVMTPAPLRGRRMSLQNPFGSARSAPDAPPFAASSSSVWYPPASVAPINGSGIPPSGKKIAEIACIPIEINVHTFFSSITGPISG